MTHQKSTIVLVGHCVPDQFMLRSAVSRAVSDATLEVVNDAEAMAAYLTSGALLLVNRELDGRFDTPNGIELIRDLASRADAPTIMLISNLEDAQAEAVAAGAAPGFGKNDLYDAETEHKLREAVAR